MYSPDRIVHNAFQLPHSLQTQISAVTCEESLKFYSRTQTLLVLGVVEDGARIHPRVQRLRTFHVYS